MKAEFHRRESICNHKEIGVEDTGQEEVGMSDRRQSTGDSRATGRSYREKKATGRFCMEVCQYPAQEGL